MISSFKVFPYSLPPLNLSSYSSLAPSLFYSSLVSSPFITTNPDDAHLFYFPVPPDLPSRSLDRLISLARSSSPFWNKSLAADHFFLSSCSTPRPSTAATSSSSPKTPSDSPIASPVTLDVSLPAPPLNRTSHIASNRTYLAFLNPEGPGRRNINTSLIHGLTHDPEFLIGSQRLGRTKFCMFLYGEVLTGLAEALQYGCVPVIITDRPIQDMPLMDVLRWQKIALFLGAGVGPTGLKRILTDCLAAEDEYQRMKRLGAEAAKHLTWNYPPKPYDAFHMVMYQLWFRRHAVRYSTWEIS